MPNFNIGDRVIYQRLNSYHDHNGHEAIVTGIDEHGYILLRFDLPNTSNRYTHTADPENVHLLIPVTPETLILQTIHRLQKRQLFYQEIGYTLPSWEYLEQEL